MQKTAGGMVLPAVFSPCAQCAASSVFLAVRDAELCRHVEIAAEDRQNDRQDIRQRDDKLRRHNRAARVGKTERQCAKHSALGCPVAQKADRKSDPAAAADDARGKHSQVAHRVECARKSADTARDEDRQKADSVDVDARDIDCHGVFTGGADGKTKGGLEKHEHRNGDQHIRKIGEDVLVEEDLADHGDLAQKRDGNFRQRVDLQRRCGNAEKHALEECAHTDSENIQRRTGDDLLLAKRNGHKGIQKRHQHTEDHRRQKPDNKASGDICPDKAAPCADEEDTLDGADHHAGALGVNLCE